VETIDRQRTAAVRVNRWLVLSVAPWPKRQIALISYSEEFFDAQTNQAKSLSTWILTLVKKRLDQ
jgi:hypothetical protein